MRYVVVVVVILFCIIVCLGCNIVKWVVDDYQIICEDFVEYVCVGVVVLYVGDVFNVVVVVVGVFFFVVELIDKVMIVVFCYFFVWFFGCQC